MSSPNLKKFICWQGYRLSVFTSCSYGLYARSFLGIGTVRAPAVADAWGVDSGGTRLSRKPGQRPARKLYVRARCTLYTYINVIAAMGGTTILKVGVQVRERSEREKNFLTPTFG